VTVIEREIGYESLDVIAGGERRAFLSRPGFRIG